MSEIKEAIQTMQQGIVMAIDRKIDEASFDKTVKGRIIKTLSASKYEVLINGITYTVKSNSTHKTGEVVNVTIPQNNYSEMFIVSNGVGAGTVIPSSQIPVAGVDVGGVRSGTGIVVDNEGNVTIADNSHKHTIDNIDGLQTVIESKASTAIATKTTKGLMSAQDKTDLDLLISKAILYGEAQISTPIPKL